MRFLQKSGSNLLLRGLIAIAFYLLIPTTALATTVPELATVYIICDDRQGSGVLTSVADGGYVVTVGHVPIDPQTHVLTEACSVGFVTDDTLQAKVYYDATVVHAVFEERADRDLALLKLGQRRTTADSFSLPAPVAINEFANLNDPMTVLGFPGGDPHLKSATGNITGYSRGTMNGNAPITPGYSGGPAIDAPGRLVGIAERVRYEVDENTGKETVTEYQYADVLTLIKWMDEFSAGEHDKYLTHFDNPRFHNAPFVTRLEGPGCAFIVRTNASPTVYCLLAGAFRLVFPNAATFQSWYADSRDVQFITAENLSEYRLIGNMTMRAPSLIKIQTDPKVYVVTDSLGTLRGLPSEERAAQLFGFNWASMVRDVPDVFFTDYRVAAPIE